MGHYMDWYSETCGHEAVALSPNQWTDDELGIEWMKLFDKHTNNGHPHLLILDSHRSHLSLEFFRYALVHNIVFLCFPAHSNRLFRLFGPPQRFYNKAADDHMRETRTRIVKGTFLRSYPRA
jgi:hypothetical protein